ncbi:hypothetical protein GCM10023187_37310 [Nibrella viscosa]|uniref:Uncharacterized protein n=1 Tax=Nibrella viscosa TaxID=1084524 RepID=A0ABP8KP48_9BACT
MNTGRKGRCRVRRWLVTDYRMGAIFSVPAVSGKRLIIGSADGVVYCLEET